jgi:hypothetical protein
VHVDRRDNVAVDLADQHHASDLNRLGIGYPQTVAELGTFAESGHELADLRPATMHHDWAQPHGSQQHRVVGHGPTEHGVDHGVAPIFDHHDGAAEPLDVGQGFQQYVGALRGVGHRRTRRIRGNTHRTLPSRPIRSAGYLRTHDALPIACGVFMRSPCFRPHTHGSDRW